MRKHIGTWMSFLTAAVLAISACGGGSSGASSSPSGGISAQLLAQVKGQVAQDRAVPKFTAPGPAVNVASIKGKHIFLIQEIPNDFNSVIQNAMKAIAVSASVNLTIYTNQGQVSQWVQGINEGIAQKPDLIILNLAPDPRSLQPQIAAAKAAGIPVLVTHFYDDSSPLPPACEGCAGGVTALVTAPFNVAEGAMADWVIADSGGSATVLVPTVEALPTAGMVTAIQSEFQKYCPSTCPVKVITIPIANLATNQLQTQIQSELIANPKINYVIDQIDAMSPATLAAIRTVGRVGKVKVLGYNGSLFAIQYLQSSSDNQIFAADAGESTDWIAYANMDQAFRIVAGMQPVPERTPFRIFDRTNASDAGNPPSLTQGYGTDYVTGFKQLWGLS
jgi:ribose transport system substrate-binding protein